MSTITIHSARDERGNAYYEQCQLLTGAGTVIFEGGKAQATPEQVTALAGNERILMTQDAGDLLIALAGGQGVGLPLGLQDASPDELDWCAAALNAQRGGPDEWDRFAEAVPAWAGWETYSDEPPADDDDNGLEPAPGGEQLPPDAVPPTGTGAGPTPDADDPAEPRPEDVKVSPDLAAAREHLRSEGEHVPKVIPEGFEATTGEGEPRCYARKGDESQCTNPAKVDGDHSTYACGLGKHIEQVAKLP